MKKVLSAFLALVLCLSLCACGGGASKGAYHLGDTVSTDIFEFTLDEATFAYALNNVKGENFFAPKQYDAANDKKNPYVADTGETLIAIKYTVTNKGRTTEQLYKAGFFTAKYDGKGYPAIGVLTLNASENTDSIRVEPGATESHRAYAEIGVDVENLTDDFTITVQIPNSSGKTEKFTYTID